MLCDDGNKKKTNNYIAQKEGVLHNFVIFASGTRKLEKIFFGILSNPKLRY